MDVLAFADAFLAQLTADFRAPFGAVPPGTALARLLTAGVLGGLIGLDREARTKPAGLRTHMLIALAACVFALLAIESVHMAGFADEQVRIDPLRVIEAVTSGVAFLAAGMIVFSRGEVRGLTTGAGMWLAGAVGLSVGLGYWFVAVVATVACFVVLFILAKIEIGSDAQDEPTRNKET